MLFEERPSAARQLLDAMKRADPEGHIVIHEEDLDDAIERLTISTAFDAAMLGLERPDPAGLEILARMQAAAPDLPIILVSSFDERGSADRALLAGAQDCIEIGEAGGEALLRALRFAVVRRGTERRNQAEIERLSNGLRAENQRIREELAVARTAQFDLQPSQARLDGFLHDFGIEVRSYFEPSLDIGGDLWGCGRSWDGKPAFYTLDFSGHGICAALNVFRLHALLREMDGRINDPTVALGHLNEMACNLLPPGQYATIFLAAVDMEANQLIWAAGGAPPPILFTPDGSARLLDTRGKPLGISKSARYEARVTPFPPGASLFLYSDAATESRVDDEQAMLGEEDLLLMARDFYSDDGFDLNGLVTRLLNTLGSPLEDDLTAVAITRLAETPSRVSHLRAGLMIDRRSEHNLPRNPLGGVGRPWIMASKRLDAIADGLTLPYNGFVEISANDVGDVGDRCYLAVERHGLCLSLTAASAASPGIVSQIVAALRRRFAGQRDWAAVEICIAEALANAIIHGSLGIKSGSRDLKAGLDVFSREVEEGLRDPKRAVMRVEVTVVPLTDGRLEIAVSDRGVGFDLERKLKSTVPRGAKSGRGLALIRKLAQDVTSRDNGRTLVVTL